MDQHYPQHALNTGSVTNTTASPSKPLTPMNDAEANAEAREITNMLARSGNLLGYIELVEENNAKYQKKQAAPSVPESTIGPTRPTLLATTNHGSSTAPRGQIVDVIQAAPSNPETATQRNRYPATRSSLRPARVGAGRPSGIGGKNYGGSGANKRLQYPRYWGLVDRVEVLLRQGKNPIFVDFYRAAGSREVHCATDKDEFRSAKNFVRRKLKQEAAQATARQYAVGIQTHRLLN